MSNGQANSWSAPLPTREPRADPLCVGYEIGAVRTIGHSVIVGQTPYSYTYTQPLRATDLYPMYHGTLEARPLGSGRSTLYYTLAWDGSTQPDDASRQKQMETYRLLFEKMLRNM